MDDPVLDKEQPMSTYRTLTGARYGQDGHLFTLGSAYIGPDPNHVSRETDSKIDEPPPDTGVAGVLARASARLAGFSEPEIDTATKQEKHKVRAAEQLADEHLS